MQYQEGGQEWWVKREFCMQKVRSYPVADFAQRSTTDWLRMA